MAAPGMSLQHPSQYLSTPAFPPERNLGPMSSHLSPPLPQMWNTNNLLPVSMGVSILDILRKFICILCGLYVCLLSLSMMPLGFIHIVVCIRTSFLFMAELCSSVAESSSCFHVLVTMNSATVNMHIQIFRQICFHASGAETQKWHN